MRALALLILGGVLGCTRRNIVECPGNETCVGFPGGECRVNSATGNQWCSYPDATCPSGFRWSEANTGDGLEGMCVNLDLDAAPSCTPQVAWLSSHDGGDKDVWVSALDGTEQHALTANDNDEDDAAWSPTGDRIAYTRVNLIWVMNADGSDQHPITSGPDGRAAWSPDGARIAFIRSSGGSAIWTVNADGTNPFSLTDIEPQTQSFAWSPDGTRIAFDTMRDGNSEVYVMQANGSTEVNLTNSSSSDYGPLRWCPDGSQIVFSSNRSGIEDVWSMMATGANPRNLNANTAQTSLVGYDCTSDGSEIIFARLGLGPIGGIYAMNSDGTGQRLLVPIADSAEVFPTVSRDGTRMTWVRALPDIEIAVAGIDGSNIVRITNWPGLDEKPILRPCP